MDPYAPPSARIDDLTASMPSRMRWLVAATAAVQAVLVCINATTYGSMISSGEVAPIMGLLALVSCVLLYAGAALCMRNARLDRYLFLGSALGLSTAWCGWSRYYSGPYPLLMGAIVASVGCLVALQSGGRGESGRKGD